jgi:hypothetical protein
MEVLTAQEKSERIFFVQPKVHQNKFADLNKMVPTNPLKMITIFEQCQATNKVAGILEKIAKDEQQPKEKIMVLIFLSRIAVNQATANIVVVNIATIIKAANATMTIANPTIVIKTIDAMIALDTMTRTRRAPQPTTRRMIASAITPRKRVTKPCKMSSPLFQAWAICLEEGVVLIQDLLCILVLVLGLALA